MTWGLFIDDKNGDAGWFILALILISKWSKCFVCQKEVMRKIDIPNIQVQSFKKKVIPFQVRNKFTQSELTSFDILLEMIGKFSKIKINSIFVMLMELGFLLLGAFDVCVTLHLWDFDAVTCSFMFTGIFKSN